jgi:hypothetical protein
MKPIHRDDLPMDVAEEVVESLQQQFPGFKVQFAGDAPGGLPPEVAEAMQKLKDQMDQSVLLGQCFDCGAQMPNYPKQGEPVPEDWEPATGWNYYSSGDEIMHWICPTCDAADEAD